MKQFILASCSLLALGIVHPVRAEETVQPRLDGYVKLGNDRMLAGTELFYPFAWNGQTLAFADIRFVADDHEGREGNLGLGVRHVPDGANYFYGVYGFFDRRKSQFDNYFSQITTGAEFLTENWDARANGYVPLSDEKTTGSATNFNLNFSGTGIVAQGTGSVGTETPLNGVDAEIGRKLTFLKDTPFEETRIYGGGFHFTASDVEDITGYRARFRTRPFEWLQLGLEHQHDNVRGATNFAEIRLRLPFGTKPTPKRKPKGIYARLNEQIVRDIDIVTQDKTVSTPTTSQPVALVNNITAAAQNVYHVDNTVAPGGDGSIATPFDTLAGAEAAAGIHDIIYVHRGDGTTTNMANGITINDVGQKLFGSGVNLTFGDLSSTATGLNVPAGTVLVPATLAPVITNGAGNGVQVQANDTKVAGITVDSAANSGVFVFNADNASVHDVTTTNNVIYGTRAHYDAAGNFTFDFRDITSNNNLNTNVIVTALNNPVVTGTLTDISINGGSGVTGGPGVNISLQSNSTVNLTLTNITSTGNATSAGINAGGIATSTVNVIMNNIRATNNLGGFNAIAQFDATTNITMNNVTATGNINSGMFFQTLNNGVLTANVSNSTSTSNANVGVAFSDGSTNAITADFGGGVLGSTGQNRIFSNTFQELLIDLDGGELKAENSWWGVGTGIPGGETNLIGGSTVDTTPFLTVDPDP